VTEAQPAPPYPADTRAKGWRFELEYERIDQSDTWSFAAEVPMAQHSLLMMWLVAWKETPCGSLPNDEAAIRAKCRIPPPVWARVRDVLMRGWAPSADGRLYHATITARVLEMLESRSKNAKRVADWKAAQREQRIGNALPTRKQQGENDTGTGTGTLSSPPSVKKKARAAPPSPVDRPADVDETVWRDWLALRKAKKSPVSPTVLDGAVAEAAKAGMSLDAFLRVWCTRGTQGLQAEWLKPHERPIQQHGTETPRERAARERVFRMTGGIFGAKPYGTSNDTIDIEPDADHAALG
jgi:hypothetical protein